MMEPRTQKTTKTAQVQQSRLAKNITTRKEKRVPQSIYDTYSKDDVTNVSVDYCYRAVCGVPQTYK